MAPHNGDTTLFRVYQVRPPTRTSKVHGGEERRVLLAPRVDRACARPPEGKVRGRHNRESTAASTSAGEGLANDCERSESGSDGVLSPHDSRTRAINNFKGPACHAESEDEAEWTSE